MATILLAAKANVEMQSEIGDTALHLSPSNRHDKVADILLATKAKVDMQSKTEETALHLASRKVMTKWSRY